MRRKARACKVFNPFELADLPLPAIHLLIDNLAEFKLSNGREIFDEAFRRNMKGEAKLAKDHASRPFDWDSIEDSGRYKDRCHRREMKAEAARVRSETEDPKETEFTPSDQSERAGEYSKPKESDNWKDDLGEYARRIWEWWLPRWLHTNEFVYFGLAIRKVVLWTLSSAIVERDFSKYVAITNACGTNLSFPTLQDRVFAMCNKDVYRELEARILEGDVDEIENQNEEEMEEDEGDVIESDGDGDGVYNE